MLGMSLACRSKGLCAALRRLPGAWQPGGVRWQQSAAAADFETVVGLELHVQVPLHNTYSFKTKGPRLTRDVVIAVFAE